MRIISMTATFGKLEKARLEPGDGLNIIYAPNEGGKSTWAAFWKAMLYGIDTRERDKKGYLADKNHYQPWSGAPMEGEIRLEWEGRDITIRRGPRGNTPFGTFSAVYTGTEEPVPGLTAANCGEMLTGAGLAVFSRSAFLGADNLTLTSAPELERRIAALVSSGEEDVSFTQVQNRLKDWLNKRRVNKSVGEIPRLEMELSQVREEQARLEEAAQQISRLEGEQRRLERQCAELVKEQRAHRAFARSDLAEKISGMERRQKELLEQRNRLQQEKELHRIHAGQELNRRYTMAAEELTSARQQLEALEREAARYGTLPDKDLLKKAQGELQYLKVLDEEIKAGEEALQEGEEAYVQAQIAAQDERFAGLTAQEAAHAIQKTQAEYTMCMNTARSKELGAKIFPFVGLAAVLVGGIWGLIQKGTFLSYPLYSGGCLLALCLLITFLSVTDKKSWQKRGQGVLERYGVTSPQELDAMAEDYAARCQQAEQAAQQVKTVRGALNDRKARRDNSWNDLLDFVHTFSPEVQNTFGCSAALSRALNLDHELASAKDRVEERRRRLEDLAAQGGTLDEAVQTVPAPQYSLTEIQQVLAEVTAQLERETEALNQARGQLSAMDSNQEEKTAPEAGTLPSRTPQETDQALAQARLGLEQVSAQLNQAQGKLRAMGDPAVLAARQEELSDALGRRSLEYDALALAMETMQQANTRLQERFSPELNRLAGEYMARLTGNKYPTITLNRELEGSVRGEGEVLPRNVLYLSRGTADQLYLAVRLAVCRLCLPDKPPIFLDDALAAFDDQRLALALTLLQELGEEQQILLFSCHERERNLLANEHGVKRLTLG